MEVAFHAGKFARPVYKTFPALKDPLTCEQFPVSALSHHQNEVCKHQCNRYANVLDYPQWPDE